MTTTTKISCERHQPQDAMRIALHVSVWQSAYLDVLDDLEAQMCHSIALNHADAFQLDWLRAEMIEKSDTSSEQDRYKINVDFVNQPSLDRLLRYICATDADVLLTSNRFCMRDGALVAFATRRTRLPLVQCPDRYRGIGKLRMVKHV